MPRVDALTGLRWWAAFFVFTFHMRVFAPLPGTISRIFDQGYMGVTFFFVLSGFVLTWSASDRVSQSTFYWRRFARIYPSHFVALLFAIPVFYDLGFGHDQVWVKPVSIGILALSFVLLQGWTLNPSVLFSGNPAAWTLTCEAFFYALHPYISKVLTPLARKGALIFGLGAIVVAFFYRFLTLLAPEAWYAAAPAPVVHLTEFALGMALAWAFRRGWHPRIPVLAGLAAMGATIASIVFVPELLSGSLIARLVSGFSNEVFTVACAVTIAAIAQRAMTGHRSLFASRLQVRLGEWSFTFYLVHATFVYIALALFGPQTASWRNLGWFALLLTAGLVGAAVLHHGVEKPLENRMRKWKDNRSRARSSF